MGGAPFHLLTMNVYLLCNPESGGGTDAEGIGERLERLGATLTGDEARAERVVVCGGDGTVGQGAALAARLGVPLAVVPTGTANDFARALGLPGELEDAARLAVQGETLRGLELGRIDGRAFVNVASVGLAPAAARLAVPLKPVLGSLAYPAGALAAGVLEQPVPCGVTTQAKTLFEGPAWQVMVAVTGAFGGVAEIDAADPGDGRLDLIVLPAIRRLALARYALAMRRGTLADASGVVHARADDLVLEVPPGTSLNVDGEVIHARGPVRFGVETGVLSVVTTG